ALGLAFHGPRELELVRAVELEALRLVRDQRDERGRIDVRPLREAQRAAGRAGLELRGAESLREQLQPRDLEQRLRRRRQQPEPVDQLDLALIELLARGLVRRAREELVVAREAAASDLAALPLAEEPAGAGDLEIVRREREADAERLERFDRLEPFRRLRRQRALRRRDQIGVGLMVRTA